ncbi:MAG TPA: PD-(D/E)XK nuclease-like domain-containing protein [Candidatus Limnocylindrales bacterium]
MKTAGVHRMGLAEYLAHPALSSSGAQKLLPPSCPALFRYEQTNPIQATPEMEFGSVTHELLLGDGHGFEVLDYPNYRTKDSQEKAKAVRAEGRIPILKHDLAVAKAMVAVVRAHPIAGKLFSGGESELTLIWDDKEFGFQRRSRIDKLKVARRALIIDYKTANSAAPDKIAKASWDYGYAQQGEYYIDGVTACELGPNPAFVLVTQMKEPPYLVTVGQYSETARAIGRELNRRALQIYAQCTETGVWPSFADDIATLSLPGWVEAQWMKDML